MLKKLQFSIIWYYWN